MDNTDPDVPSELKKRASDFVASGAAATLSMVPFAGPFLAEIAFSIIPGQQLDRIVDFAAKLGDRVERLEQETLAGSLDDEEFTDLVGEAMRQAARSTSDERRVYLASLLANSLTTDALEHSESRHLLRLLGELNDVEVLWLRFYCARIPRSDEEFRQLHAHVFEQKFVHMGSSQEEFDEKALRDSYHDHLVQLGLLQRKLAVDGDGAPEVDKFSGALKYKSTQTSRLGRLLLRSIGMETPE